jgi:hypothetical protein
MDLSSLLSSMQTALVALQSGVASVSILLDTSDLATVMGPAAKTAGVQAPQVLQSRVKDDELMNKGLTGLENDQKAAIRKATRSLMNEYAKEVAGAVLDSTVQQVQSDMTKPSRDLLKSVASQVKSLMVIQSEVSKLAARLVVKSTNANAMSLIEEEYSSNSTPVLYEATELLDTSRLLDSGY